MLLVIVDANRVISALISLGLSFEVFLLNESVNKIEFIAPEFLFFELGKNLGEKILKRKISGLPENCEGYFYF